MFVIVSLAMLLHVIKLSAAAVVAAGAGANAEQLELCRWVGTKSRYPPQ
jgi:hypothetical protein